MKSYFAICSSKWFWLKESLRHPKINRVWRECLSCEGLGRDELVEIQHGKLQDILFHAASTVPYYKNWFKRRGGGVKTRELRLNDFPIIEKKDIRGHEEEFASKVKDMPAITWSRTSGSTGEPFRFGRSEFDYTYATLWRGLLRFGIRPGDKRVLVKGVDELANVSRLTKIKRYFYGVVNRCIVVDAHFLAKSETNIISELDRIVRYRPRYFHGYASSIYLLAQTAEEKGIDLASLKIKAVVTESEKCHPFQRELIERVFKASVVENYGCVEFGMLAQPASDGTLCINDDHVWVETDDADNAIITNLDEYAFPLIRYRNGDRLKLGPIHKSLPYHTITSLEGRVAETIHLPQGGSLQGYIVMYPISKHLNVIRSYQVYQPDIEHLSVRIVPVDKTIPEKIAHQIETEMREIVGSKIFITIELKDAIPLTKRGKCAFVISDVKK